MISQIDVIHNGVTILPDPVRGNLPVITITCTGNLPVPVHGNGVS